MKALATVTSWLLSSRPLLILLTCAPGLVDRTYQHNSCDFDSRILLLLHCVGNLEQINADRSHLGHLAVLVILLGHWSSCPTRSATRRLVCILDQTKMSKIACSIPPPGKWDKIARLWAHGKIGGNLAQIHNCSRFAAHCTTVLLA